MTAILAGGVLLMLCGLAAVLVVSRRLSSDSRTAMTAAEAVAKGRPFAEGSGHVVENVRDDGNARAGQMPYQVPIGDGVGIQQLVAGPAQPGHPVGEKSALPPASLREPPDERAGALEPTLENHELSQFSKTARQRPERRKTVANSRLL
jgi:hypothetical protein